MGDKFTRPVRYMYLDEYGIASLYAQTANRVEVEVTEGGESEKHGKVAIKAGIGKLIASLTGIDVSVEPEVEMSSRRLQETKYAFSIEQKLNALLRYMANLEGDSYFVQLKSAAQTSRKIKGGVYVNIAAKFKAVQFESGGGGVEAVNQIKAVDFRIGPPLFDSYNHADDYYKTKSNTIFMSASLEKFINSRDGLMRTTGHDAVILRSLGAQGIPLNVFGHLKSLTNFDFQIKPYAIWL